MHAAQGLYGFKHQKTVLKCGRIQDVQQSYGFGTEPKYIILTRAELFDLYQI
jgi:hypothetical protein